MARPPKGMHAEDIKAALRRRHGTLRALAKAWGKHPATISRVLKEPRYSIPTERLIAEALDKHPFEIWPDRWTEAGDRVASVSEANGNRINHILDSQKRHAA